MNCGIEMSSGGMMYISSFMVVSSGIQVRNINILYQQFERL
jgi:hypothetical protein